ncbi:hypothetical protein EMPS_04094 [Entomortierella parvispora]|uniref:Uncharacterized protein n=1 Tax=Entomortierella parvispora TaxID=205924 RepID=A0A9P3LV74_9FUNG|nr:hypothetical protein EMPS_04094 [Entomortierella parvispora]
MVYSKSSKGNRKDENKGAKSLTDPEISWFQETRDKAPGVFFDQFGIIQCDDGHRRYMRCLGEADIPEQERTLLTNKFEAWKNSEGRTYWERQNAKAIAKKMAWKTAGHIIGGSEPFAESIIAENAEEQRQYSVVPSDMPLTSVTQHKEHTAMTPPAPLPMNSMSAIPDGKSQSADDHCHPFLNAPLSTTGSSPFTIGALSSTHGASVGASSPSSLSSNVGTSSTSSLPSSVGTSSASSLSSTVRTSSSSSKSRGRSEDSLVDGIKRRRTEKDPATFRSLVDIAHAMHFGIYEALPEFTAVDDILPTKRQKLCHLSLSYLKKGSDATKYPNPDYSLPLKDAFVSLSGVWNMFCQTANATFKDEYQRALDVCAVKELDTPDAGFSAIVAPLMEIAEGATTTDAGVKAQVLISKIYELQAIAGSEPYCRSLDALKTILKHAERPLSGRTKDASEGDAVSLWSAIFREQLPATACLALNLGEQGLAAARQSNLDLFTIFGINAGTRKCDSIMTVEHLELANFELKKALCTDVKEDIQLRRTIKAMKSISLLLRNYGLMCPPVCVMRGMEATIFSLKMLDDIWVAGPACDKILLPQMESEILDFMKNDMHRLFSLLMLYDRYSKEVLVKKAEYERRIRRGNRAILPPSNVEMESDLEWDLLVLNSPAKQTGRRKSIMDQLKDDDEEGFALNSPSSRKSIELERTDIERSIASKLRSLPGKPKSFAERLKAAADAEEDGFTDSDTC